MSSNLSVAEAVEQLSSFASLARPYLPYIVAPLCFCGVYKFLAYLVPGPQHSKKLTLKDRTVLITGASSGVGRALAFEFYAKGAKVILTARSINKLEEVCAELEAAGETFGWANPHKPAYRYLDLTELNGYDTDDSRNQLNELRSLAIDGKTIDVLVNNAGVSNRGSCATTTLDVQRRVMEVNYFGAVTVTRRLLSAIPDDGAVVSIGSVQSRVALPYRSAYSASKHAIQAFFDSLRGEERNLHILVVNAGYINTGFGAAALDAHGKTVGYHDENQKAGISPETAARKIVDALVARQTELFLAKFQHRILILVRALAPNLLWWILRRRAKKELEKREAGKSALKED